MATSCPAGPAAVQKARQTGTTVVRVYVDGPYGQLHIRLAGPGEQTGAPPLVFFHQSPRSSLEYEPLIALMARDRLCIAPDTPGYGASDPPPGPLSIGEYTAALLQGLDQLGMTAGTAQVDVFGFHTGALLAAEAAIQRPSLVRRLVLAGVPYVVGEERAERYRIRVAERLRRPLSGSHLIDAWHSIVTMRPSGMSIERAEALLVDSLLAGDRAWWAYEGVFTYPSEHELPKVRQPSLLLAVNDLLFENTHRAAQVMPNAQVVEMLEVTGHHILDQHAEEIAERIREWLG